MRQEQQHDLLFHLADTEHGQLVDEWRRFVQGTMALRTWSCSPPQFIDEIDDSSCTEPEDLPVVTIGLLLRLAPPWSPQDSEVAKESDRKQLEDVESLIRDVSVFSRQHQVTIGVCYNGEDIGEVEKGVPDNSLQKGLLDEWHRRLGG